MKVPFVDLYAQYLTLKPQMDEAIATVIQESAFIRGRFVAEFEHKYAAAYGVKHCISVANGTDAIYILLRMLGIGPGDEVITTANSWIASSETITQAGARVVFADVEKDFYHFDPSDIERKITPKTKAVLAVHLLGQPADMERIVTICKERGIILLEDCAQAHFATYKGKRVGTFGRAATFSFYPGKNLGAYGDAGAIITDDDELAERCRAFARHGAHSTNKHEHVMEGVNSRLDGLQAAVLLVKLPRIGEWNESRFRCALRYNELLANIPDVITPKVRPNATHIFHAYVVRVPNRNQVQQHLTARGVATTIHYPKPLPLLSAYRYLGHQPSDFPVAHQLAMEMLSLPLFPEMGEEMIQFVCATLKGALQVRSSANSLTFSAA